jgi:hypothetical protein
MIWLTNVSPFSEPDGRVSNDYIKKLGEAKGRITQALIVSRCRLFSLVSPVLLYRTNHQDSTIAMPPKQTEPIYRRISPNPVSGQADQSQSRWQNPPHARQDIGINPSSEGVFYNQLPSAGSVDQQYAFTIPTDESRL